MRTFQSVLGRTRKFTDILRSAYKIDEQMPVTLYCEYRAKVDLSIKKTSVLCVDLTDEDNITCEEMNETDTLQTLTDEYKAE